MKIIDSLKRIKNFIVLIVPDPSMSGAKSRKFSIKRIAVLLGLYSIIIAVAGYLFFSFTPLENLIFPGSTKLTETELQKIDELNNRMLFLSKELEGLKSTNEKLRYAIMLGDSTLIESLTVKLDTSDLKKKAGGSIYSAFKKLFFTQEEDQTKNYYFLKPVDGFVSREFNPEKGHVGVDYVVKTGTPVFAAADGFIIFSDYTVNDGYMIIINHPGDYITVYKHLSSIVRRSREIVRQGELIALSGNTGEITTGPHLHFEIWLKGQPQNPKTLLINQ